MACPPAIFLRHTCQHRDIALKKEANPARALPRESGEPSRAHAPHPRDHRAPGSYTNISIPPA